MPARRYTGKKLCSVRLKNLNDLVIILTGTSTDMLCRDIDTRNASVLFISEGRHIKYFVEETKVSFFQLCNIKNIRRWKSILFKFSFLLGLHLVFSLNICSWIYNVFSLILRKANSEENFTDNILEWLDQNITGKRTNRIKTFKHMYILLPFLHRFLMILVGRISLNIKTFHLRDHFLYSH